MYLVQGARYGVCMSKASSKKRRRVREELQRFLARYEDGFIQDEVVRRLGIVGDGTVSLTVRAGHVIDAAFVELPAGDPELRRQLRERHEHRRLYDALRAAGERRAAKRPPQRRAG